MSNRNSHQSGHATEPSSTAVHLQQQGTVDWTAVANESVSFSVKELSHLSKAGVEGLTICAARAMFRDVKLSNNGELRLHRALRNICAFPSTDERLRFGVGIRHIIWDMRESAEGLTCLAICASLVESYTTAAAARIMRELFLLYNPPSELTPGLSQWQALVEASEGILAPTEFGLVLHELTRLCSRDGLPNKCAYGPPRDIAIALRQLFEVSAGRMDRFHLSGGADCAWIAVVAHWLFCLRVEIQEEDGTTRYQPEGSRSELFPDAQVIIIYTRGADRLPLPLPVEQKQYIIPSGPLLLTTHERGEDCIMSYGRVGWHTCLVDTFGNPMKLLLTSQSRTTGAYLGSAARIFSAAMGELTLPMDTPVPDGLPASSSVYGTGFYLLARRQFAELNQTTVLIQEMETALDLSYLGATQQLSQSFTELSHQCICAVCLSAGHSIEQDGSFCLILLVQTICTLVRIMSLCSMQRGLDIYPARSGIEEIYWCLSSRRLESLRDSGGDPAVLDSADQDLLWSWEEQDSLAWMQILFTGSDDIDIFASYRIRNSAVATRNGLCFCVNTLTEITSDPQRACMIMVVPGKIEFCDSIYHRVLDLESDPNDFRTTHGGTYNAVSAQVINQSDTLADSSSADLKAELIADESTAVRKVLKVTYRITTPEFSGKCFLVGPRMIAEKLINAFTAASCKGKSCRSVSGFQSILVEGEGLLYPFIGLLGTHFPVTRVLSSQDLAIWISLSQPNLETSADCEMELSHELQGEQCIGCSVVKPKETDHNVPR
ncbi:hypothetical protein HG530_006693 [Fusarium avenaceum]|nr:hypothetical protein HG530_006693 [Fusarium avenaceum]